MSRTLATLVILTLAACGGRAWRVCDGSEITAPDGTFVVAPPQGWVQFLEDSEAVWLTRDGAPLQSIHANSFPVQDLYPEGWGGGEPDLPHLAERLEAGLRREVEAASLVRISLEPTNLDGLDAIALHVRTKSRNDPSSDQLLVCTVTANRVYLLSYTARSLRFYGRDLPAFDLVCQSFRRR